MKLLYASRTESVHDARFLDAWSSQGVDVSAVTLADGVRSASVAAFRDAVTRFQPDVVQAGPIVDVGYLVALEWDGPLVLASWGFDLMRDVDESQTHRERAIAALARASVVLTDNDAVTERAVALGASPDAIVQFPWGIDIAAFDAAGPDLRVSLGWDADAWVVGCTRQHEPLYDVETVLRGFGAFAVTMPQARLLLVGDGALSPGLQALAAQLGIADITAFTGALSYDRLPDVYRTLNTYVSASHVDGSSVSLLEAMASGVAVCVSDIPGNKQWVTSQTGLSFPVGDSDALGRQLGAVASGVAPDGRPVADLVARARELVEARADWSITRTKFPHIATLAVERHTGVM